MKYALVALVALGLGVGATLAWPTPKGGTWEVRKVGTVGSYIDVWLFTTSHDGFCLITMTGASAAQVSCAK